ncbi:MULTISPECIES: DUF1439 domain-containing protein [Luteimonas]|uniref:DUF1439 domain-containing protein n=1 Tax=Luteimonas TaxID=83614 RepID=UPI000C7E556C|nr:MULTISPECIES: DUF1439 domain-containing protein [Luteimonas]
MRYVSRISLVVLLLGVAACTSLGVVSAWLNDQVAFTAPQLQRQLDNRFPRSFEQLGGLVSVTLDNPRLQIPANGERLQLDFDLGIDGVGSADRPGHLSLVSGLRYDPATRGLHLENPELLQFDLPGSNALLRGGARGVVNSLLAEYARTEPVYRLDDDLLSKLPAGKRIGTVSIEDARVVVHLAR